MPQLFFNNFKTTPIGLLTTSQTELSLKDMTRVPDYVAGNWFKMVLMRGVDFEIVWVTSWDKTTKKMTLVRAQDGTSARDWPAIETDVFVAPVASDHAFFNALPFTNLTGTPVKLAGYGLNEIRGATNTTFGYTGELLTSTTEVIDGNTKSTFILYNADNTIKSVEITYLGLKRTETFTYTDGKITGTTATEVTV